MLAEWKVGKVTDRVNTYFIWRDLTLVCSIVQVCTVGEVFLYMYSMSTMKDV